VDLAGIENIEGRKTYRLHVKLASGARHDVWIDAKTFLDAKYDRTSYRPTGEAEIVSVLYRSYQTVDGLQIPGTLEIGGGPRTAAARMVIEKIALNPPLDDKVFANPGGTRRRQMATVDVKPPAGDPRQAFGPTGTAGIAAPQPGPPRQ
jgi:hypothetical protein